MESSKLYQTVLEQIAMGRRVAFGISQMRDGKELFPICSTDLGLDGAREGENELIIEMYDGGEVTIPMNRLISCEVIERQEEEECEIQIEVGENENSLLYSFLFY